MLKTKFEFHITRKYGLRFADDFFHIFVLKAKEYDGPARIGIVTSNKLSKSAVKRNRLRRLIKESLRLYPAEMPAGLWIVINPTTKSLDLNYAEVNTKISSLLQKAFVAN